MHASKVFLPAKSKYLVFTADYIVPSFICLTIIALTYLALYSPFFQVANIRCLSDYEECQDPSLLAELDKLKGQNIFKLNRQAISAHLISGNFMIREASLTKELPSTLHLDLQSVYPAVALQVSGDPTWIVLDPHFRVIGSRPTDPNVPTVIVPGPLTVTLSQPPGDELITQVLKLARYLADEQFNVKTITLVDEGNIELSLPNGKKAIFTTKKDIPLQLRALQAVLSDATITAGVKTIDVRFSQPVLR